MTDLRLLLVTPRFWPQWGGTEKQLAALAAAWSSAGAHTTVLTRLWEAAGTAIVDCSGVRVVRLAQRSGGWRRTYPFAEMAVEWLGLHRREFDLALVTGLDDSAAQIMAAARAWRLPVVLRAGHAGLRGDCWWQLETSRGLRAKQSCLRATALVATSRATERELIAAGYPRERITYIAKGVRVEPLVNELARRDARRTLAEVVPTLATSRGTILAVCTGPLTHEQCGSVLLDAWRHVVELRRGSKPAVLWIVGDGPEREALRESIVRQNLHGGVVLTGAFDSVEDVLQAADVYVSPAGDDGPPLSTLEALACGLPTVAAATAGNRELMESDIHGLLVPPNDPQAMAAAVDQLMADRERAQRLGIAARARVEREFSLGRAVDAYLQVFRNAVAATRC